jgi:gluconolactonase
MTRILTFLLAIVLLLPVISRAQTKSKKFSNEGEFTSNCEGPAVDEDGNVYAVNFARDGTIAQISKKGNASFFVTLPKGSTGNGIRFVDKNTFYVADFTGHNILKVDMITRDVSVLANEPKMNQPNDLAVTASGHIFASDPNWKEGTGQIWHITPERKVNLAFGNMGTTNGIDVSPDEKKLYVNESVQRNVWVFDLAADGTLSNKKLLHHFEDGGMDGMRCDVHGNIYIARHGKGEVARAFTRRKSDPYHSNNRKEGFEYLFRGQEWQNLLYHFAGPRLSGNFQSQNCRPGMGNDESIRSQQ